MRFMMLMLPGAYDPETPMDPNHFVEMSKFNDAMHKAGVVLDYDGLHPQSEGARVSFAGGKPTVTDGPFSEAKEVVGGYWMIQVKSRAEAIEWASRCPGTGSETIEIRQVWEPAEFPAEIREAIAEHGLVKHTSPK